MGNFKEIFENYGGDYQDTMERFMGNEAMYLRIMDMLFADDSLQKLGSSLESGDMTGAFEAAHTLKGVVGNMGLTPLYKTVCAMVEPLRFQEPRDDYMSLYRVIGEQFQKADELRGKLKGGV